MSVENQLSPILPIANSIDSIDDLSEANHPNPRQVLKICLNLKRLIDKVIPTVFSSDEISGQNSTVINAKVVQLAYQAAGGKGDGKPKTSSHKYRGALIFCLLKVCDWYWQLADTELSDTELFTMRAQVAQELAKTIIEETKDVHYLFISMLCHRYTINLNDVDSSPSSALELAVDMHSTTVISSSGYQRCIKWLWRGWIVQSSKNPQSYVLYKEVSSHSFSAHFKPSRLKTPLYQNTIEIIFSVCYLILFTLMVNIHTEAGASLGKIESWFYLFTLGLVIDEVTKLYHVGKNYIGFWNAFNDTMYAIVGISIIFRLISLQHSYGTDKRIYFDEISYRFLSCASPFMWSRLLLYLDAEKFVGAMIVVIQTMMKESIIFFFLLSIVILGFAQGFLGLDSADGKREATAKIFLVLSKTIMGDTAFDVFDSFSPPFASVLYYVYTFTITVILLNILVALYSTAYSNIVDNATDEYLALVAQKTLRYIRAPDENLYVPPFNLLELAITPISIFLDSPTFDKLNYYIMVVIYSPLLLYISFNELVDARRIQYNRFKGVPDDANENDTEWDLTDGYEDNADGVWDGIQERNSAIRTSLEHQRLAESEDPEFAINVADFDAKIEEATQPVQKAYEKGVKWELYDLHAKLDQLTELVKVVVKENSELKAKLGP